MKRLKDMIRRISIFTFIFVVGFIFGFWIKSRVDIEALNQYEFDADNYRKQYSFLDDDIVNEIIAICKNVKPVAKHGDYIFHLNPQNQDFYIANEKTKKPIIMQITKADGKEVHLNCYGLVGEDVSFVYNSENLLPKSRSINFNSEKLFGPVDKDQYYSDDNGDGILDIWINHSEKGVYKLDGLRWVKKIFPETTKHEKGI
jgi:hypothetical protein